MLIKSKRKKKPVVNLHCVNCVSNTPCNTLECNKWNEKTTDVNICITRWD